MLDALIHNAYEIKREVKKESHKRTMHRIILVLTLIQNVLGGAHDASEAMDEIKEMEAGAHE